MRTIGNDAQLGWGLAPIIIVVILAVLSCVLYAQDVPGGPNVFGVYVDPSGSLGYREKDAAAQLAQLRLGPTTRQAEGKLHYLSLARLFGEVRANLDSQRPLTAEQRYLQGLTQIRYVFLYPEAGDLVLAGPAEPFVESANLQPRGKLTGRPILHLDDLITALRTAHQRDPQPFGCSIDPPEQSVQRGQEVLRRYGNRSRRELADALASELGPQQIRFFGTPPDSRTALICVAADYKLKRESIGIDPPPIAGLGNSIDNSRVAGNAFWFELCYEPLLVSPDSTAYALRGPRLQLKTGHVPFDDKGATPRAQAYARQFSAKMEQIALRSPLYAELQNIADLALVASLIRHDRLAQKAKVDLGWLLADDSIYAVETVRVPRFTETLVNYTNGSLAAGGVRLNAAPALKSRETDEAGVLTPLKAVRSRP